MNARNLVVFRNYPNIDEPMISSVFGYLSLRNIMVFAIFGGISFVLFKLIMPDNFSIEDNLILFIITVTPAIVGVLLALIKPKWGSADSIILSLIYMNHKNKKHHAIKMPKKSNFFPRCFWYSQFDWQILLPNQFKMIGALFLTTYPQLLKQHFTTVSVIVILIVQIIRITSQIKIMMTT